MQFTATQIATIIGARIEGNADAAVAGFGKIEEAIAGQLAFLANPKYEEYLYNCERGLGAETACGSHFAALSRCL
jgi:UDP-3-O-[3-hydroxymyristoyl] glucosamine N-acyltransferase